METCGRLDVIVSPDVFGDGSTLDVVDRFVFRDSEMEVICSRLYRDLCLGGFADRLYVELLVTQLAVSLLERHSVASSKAPISTSGGLTRTQALRVLDYIESSLSRQLTLSELAGVADLSLHHFAHMFKRTIGTPPHRYVLNRRVERVKRMLCRTSASLVEVGLCAGFSSQSHVTSAFRRVVGATPAQFQEFNRSNSS